MTVRHTSLAAGRWETLPLILQMANVGSEVGRAFSWKNKGNREYAQDAFIRALELLDLTISDPRNRTRLKELTRTREALCDFFFFDNQYHSTEQMWHTYFLAFAYAARAGR